MQHEKKLIQPSRRQNHQLIIETVIQSWFIALLFGCIGEYVPVLSQHSLIGLQWWNFAILSERDRLVYVRSVKLQVLRLISLQTGPHVPKSTFILERHIGSQSRRKKHVVFQFSPWKMFSNKMLKSPTRSNKNQKGNWAHPPIFCKDPQCCRHLGPRILGKTQRNLPIQVAVLDPFAVSAGISNCTVLAPATCATSVPILEFNHPDQWNICVPGSINSLRWGSSSSHLPWPESFDGLLDYYVEIMGELGF